jgi:ABC-type cobalamin/Fe3+-siderophores transport system ATPase subunit
VVALYDVSFSVGRGQLVGFLGPNGAGKTTAMRAILDVVETDAGEVRWDGSPITRTVRQRIDYMPAERGILVVASWVASFTFDSARPSTSAVSAGQSSGVADRSRESTRVNSARRYAGVDRAAFGSGRTTWSRSPRACHRRLHDDECIRYRHQQSCTG